MYCLQKQLCHLLSIKNPPNKISLEDLREPLFLKRNPKHKLNLLVLFCRFDLLFNQFLGNLLSFILEYKQIHSGS